MRVDRTTVSSEREDPSQKSPRADGPPLCRGPWRGPGGPFGFGRGRRLSVRSQRELERGWHMGSGERRFLDGGSGHAHLGQWVDHDSQRAYGHGDGERERGPNGRGSRRPGRRQQRHHADDCQRNGHGHDGLRRVAELWHRYDHRHPGFWRGRQVRACPQRRGDSDGDVGCDLHLRGDRRDQHAAYRKQFQPSFRALHVELRGSDRHPQPARQPADDQRQFPDAEHGHGFPPAIDGHRRVERCRRRDSRRRHVGHDQPKHLHLLFGHPRGWKPHDRSVGIGHGNRQHRPGALHVQRQRGAIPDEQRRDREHDSFRGQRRFHAVFGNQSGYGQRHVYKLRRRHAGHRRRGRDCSFRRDRQHPGHGQSVLQRFRQLPLQWNRGPSGGQRADGGQQPDHHQQRRSGAEQLGDGDQFVGAGGRQPVDRGQHADAHRGHRQDRRRTRRRGVGQYRHWRQRSGHHPAGRGTEQPDGEPGGRDRLGRCGVGGGHAHADQRGGHKRKQPDDGQRRDHFAGHRQPGCRADVRDLGQRGLRRRGRGHGAGVAHGDQRTEQSDVQPHLRHGDLERGYHGEREPRHYGRRDPRSERLHPDRQRQRDQRRHHHGRREAVAGRFLRPDAGGHGRLRQRGAGQRGRSEPGRQHNNQRKSRRDGGAVYGRGVLDHGHRRNHGGRYAGHCQRHGHRHVQRCDGPRHVEQHGQRGGDHQRQPGQCRHVQRRHGHPHPGGNQQDDRRHRGDSQPDDHRHLHEQRRADDQYADRRRGRFDPGGRRHAEPRRNRHQRHADGYRRRQHGQLLWRGADREGYGL